MRFFYEGERAYMVCTAAEPPNTLIEALLEDSGGNLTLLGLEDDQAIQVGSGKWKVGREPLRNQYDYIYRRADLAALKGGTLKAKRNHVNHFRAEHPHFEYRVLSPTLFDECRRVTATWQEGKEASETIATERRVMETVFAHWEELGMLGGSIFVDGSMVAFTYGAAVATDTIDVCVEKADRNIEGAFSIINQQFAEHLPEQYLYLNREEDMGLPGLRKSQLSYHPEILLTYNALHIA